MAREKRFAIEKGGERRLLLRWRGFWKNIEVVLDGQSLGEPIPDFKALRLGRGYPMPDGRMLFVQFENKFAGGGLAVTIDGRPLPGANNDPRTAIRTAAILLWVIAALNLVLGLILTSAHGGRGPELAIPIAVAAVLAGLGFAVFKYQSRAALLVAIILEVVDGVATIAMMSGGGRIPTTGVIFRVFIIAALVRAYRAVGEARRLEQEELVDTFR
ncbi:MAG: hypothetical protein U1F43_06845 [Myxococcota bacterium]